MEMSLATGKSEFKVRYQLPVNSATDFNWFRAGYATPS